MTNRNQAKRNVQTNTNKSVAPAITKETTNLPAIIPVEPEKASNSPNLILLGKEAVKLIIEGDAKRGKGSGIFTYVIAQAWHTKRFETITSLGLDSFDLDEYFRKVGVEIDKTGRKLVKPNNKLNVARTNQLAKELFGIEGTKRVKNGVEVKGVLEYFTPSQSQIFKKAINLVSDMIALHVNLSMQVTLDKDHNLCVPQKLFFQPSDKAPSNIKTAFKATQDMIMQVSSFEQLLKTTNTLAGGAKRGPKQRTDAEKLGDALNEITGKAKAVALELESNKIDTIDIELRKKMQNALLAIQGAFDQEKKAQERSAKAEQEELAKKVKANA